MLYLSTTFLTWHLLCGLRFQASLPTNKEAGNKPNFESFTFLLLVECIASLMSKPSDPGFGWIKGLLMRFVCSKYDPLSENPALPANIEFEL